MRGESLVAAYARRELKMKILARNVRCPGGEIDIVGLHDGDLVFVEVRTRSSDDNGPPEKTVDHRKQRFLLRSARWYMARRRLMHLNARFDLAAVIWPPQAKPVIRYHRSYFSG
jgi:putative endonuclease